MAELEDLMLTAGHDLQTVKLPVKLDTARGKERYTLLRGEEQTLKAGDMYVADQEGVISSVIYGPDLRTRITAKTQEALFCAYAPPGIAAQAVEAHLDHIEANARLVAPGMERLHLQVYSAE
jgi:DNA/RNA-binding domain of Phe-tRNA-synthetase-like protein